MVGATQSKYIDLAFVVLGKKQLGTFPICTTAAAGGLATLSEAEDAINKPLANATKALTSAASSLEVSADFTFFTTILLARHLPADADATLTLVGSDVFAKEAAIKNLSKQGSDAAICDYEICLFAALKFGWLFVKNILHYLEALPVEHQNKAVSA